MYLDIIILNLLNLLNYFASSTGAFKLFAQVHIFKLIQVSNSYTYLLKKNTHISKKINKFNKSKNRKTRLLKTKAKCPDENV